MSKRVVRPWDKGAKSMPAMYKAKLNNNSNQDASTDADAQAIPFVQVDGVRYYSDRFYLNRTALDDPIGDYTNSSSTRVPGSASASAYSASCTCGARSPPPLLDRSRLVASLKLKAVILATYTLDPASVSTEFPTLFHADATIPVLVLHGQKGWTPYENRNKKNNHGEYEYNDDDDNDDDRDDESVNAAQPPFKSNTVAMDDDGSDDDDCTVGTQEEATMQAADIFKSPETPNLAVKDINKDLPGQVPPRKSRVTFGSKDSARLPNHVHWTEVLPSWIPPHDLPSPGSGVSTTNEDGTVSSAVREKRQFKRGVHHPKFMILLEESGSVVVVVSTGNLVRCLTTEGSWVQRFPAAPKPSSLSTVDKTDGSDFGAVLANMLQCQTWASQTDQLSPAGFVRRYLEWKNLRHLERNFDYSRSQVHLVATVPGEHEGRLSHSPRSNPTEQFYYGRQRVAHILAGLSGSRQPWLPPIVLHKEDRLVFQPTSLGSEWNRRNMSEVVRSYLGLDDRKTSQEHHTDQSLLGRLDIVWPTRDFMREVHNSIEGRQSPDSVTVVEAGFSPPARLDPDTPEGEQASYLFLSSETFNKIDLCCLSQMVMFEPSVPNQHPLTLPPHFKSVARLCEGGDYRLRKDYGFKKCEEHFSWFLLTSACLSRGAQGEAEAKPRPGSDAVSYSNFELGVLFCSRLQGRTKTDRLYCWKPAQCSCARSTGGPSLIHLPVPFCFRPSRYQEDEDDAEFCETPHFHEIPPGTGSVGHMLLTPYGAALAAKHA
jgi:hypothetical protein